MPQNTNELLQDLVHKYAKLYMKLAVKHGVPYDDAEDIAMEAIWSFYKSEHFGKLDETETRIMMARIVKNKCIDYYRKNKEEDDLRLGDCEEELGSVKANSSCEPENKAIENENYRYIRETIENLKDVWRDTAKMYFLESRTFSEISEALGISEDVCRSRISRARKYLREKLRDMNE
ncbi:MAG: sigma-70 family RNA polymerase sigma factor [Lachnospiraceae bacterium]|nr:sigma-70 family RNA polymerase sigma factor [Lachnospiraceae bacterium]